MACTRRATRCREADSVIVCKSASKPMLPALFFFPMLLAVKNTSARTDPLPPPITHNAQRTHAPTTHTHTHTHGHVLGLARTHTPRATRMATGNRQRTCGVARGRERACGHARHATHTRVRTHARAHARAQEPAHAHTFTNTRTCTCARTHTHDHARKAEPRTRARSS